jgi:hypothetical protein
MQINGTAPSSCRPIQENFLRFMSLISAKTPAIIPQQLPGDYSLPQKNSKSL